MYWYMITSSSRDGRVTAGRHKSQPVDIELRCEGYGRGREGGRSLEIRGYRNGATGAPCLSIQLPAGVHVIINGEVYQAAPTS